MKKILPSIKKLFTPSFVRKSGRILMIVFSAILTASVAAGAMLEANSDQVNNYLGTKTTETTGGGSYDTYTPDEEYLNADGSANTAALVEAHKQLGIQMAEEGTVLLKNKNSALPLSSSEMNVTLLGYASTAAGANYGMSVGSPEAESQNVSFYEALTDAGFSVNSTIYKAYTSVGGSSEPSLTSVASAAGVSSLDSAIGKYSDAAIIVIGRDSSENTDYSYYSSSSSGTSYLALTSNELELIKWACSSSKFKKVIVVLTTTSAMELGALASSTGDYSVDAILQAGFPGNYGFIGVANIIKGDANPSGRLVDTYATNSGSSPAMVNFGDYSYSNYSSSGVTDNDDGENYVVYAEGIYVGYKYYETRYEDCVLNQGNASSSAGVFASSNSKWSYSEEVTYSFGYGLSYTTFSQEITKVEWGSGHKTATITVKVSNTGSVAGKSVVQVYGQSPYTQYDKDNGIEKASVQLLAYEKTEEIPAGESVQIEVEVDMQYLASYDSKKTGSYIMEKGDYYFALGWNNTEEGAHAAINNILACKLASKSTTTTTTTTENGMDCTVTDSEYKATVRKFTWDESENTFSTSKAGVTVSNQLSDLDYNNYNSGTVTYLSRSNWCSTWPTEYKSLTITSSMVSYLKNDFHTNTTTSTEELPEFGQDGEYNFPDMFGADFDDDRWDDVINQITLESAVNYTATGNRSFYAIDEIHFLSSNSYVENGSVGIQKTLSQQSDSNSPWYVSSSDSNANYYTNTFCSPTVMAATWNKDLLEEMGELWGNDALFENIPMVWAPSINIHRTPYNGRNGDYYSEDPIISGYSALSVGKGAISKGLITTIKHYAFNNQETNRIGVSTFMTEQTARETELRGFQIALEGYYDEDGNRSEYVLGLMTAYNRAGATYSAAHTGLMQGILRGEWNYNGYATSDLLSVASTYMPYEESMLAGLTNYDLSTSNGKTIWTVSSSDTTRRTISSIISDIQNDAEILTAIKQNLKYSLYTWSRSNLANWMTSDTKVVWVLNWWRGTYISLEALGGVFIAGGGTLFVLSYVGPLSDNWKRKAGGKQ